MADTDPLTSKLFLQDLADAFVELYARNTALQSLLVQNGILDIKLLDSEIQTQRKRLDSLPVIDFLKTSRQDEQQLSTVLKTLKTAQRPKL